MSNRTFKSYLNPPSIRNYLSGVKLLHLFSGADYPFIKDFVLSLTLRGIALRTFHTPRRAPPVSPSLLLRLSSFLLLNGDPRSATLLCAFLFAFFLMACLANIVRAAITQAIWSPPSPDSGWCGFYRPWAFCYISVHKNNSVWWTIASYSFT